MAEGSSSTPANGAKTEDASRGRPYYDKIRKDLKANLEKKKELDKNLAQIEASIALKEQEYLENTSLSGNIIKGFDGYLKPSGASSATAGTATRRKGGYSEQDKIFSRSSLSWNTETAAPLSLTINSASATPSEATPAGTNTSARNTPVASGKAGNKKKKAAVLKDDDEDERPAKRGKVSWGVRD